MDSVFTIAMYYLAPAALMLLIGGFAYKIARVITLPMARPQIPKGRKLFFRFIDFVVGFIKAILLPLYINAVKGPISFIGSFLLFHLCTIALLLLFGPHMIAALSTTFPWLLNFLSSLKIPLPHVVTQAALTDLTLWGPLDMLLNADMLAVLGFTGLCMIIGYKIYYLATKTVKCNLGDYIALALVFLAFITGYGAAHKLMLYEEALAWHIVFTSLIILYIPFSKFSHPIYDYWVGKIVKGIKMSRKEG
ncbi:MAG: hypothetical protein DRJ33_06990 [Candidatus Methanomethylicota archaeon]|uniref:NarG-like domain-containing protein n=1 Tax=Thermoproteota archaeon TaxID=2056631 RepID=A0A497EUY8_9CREN|nr:MAG: hypothetical protein DRJ33_06990 [Candidatus Verstraetearchaeota archaeon]